VDVLVPVVDGQRSGRPVELEAGGRLTDGVDLEGPGRLDGSGPDVDAVVGGLDRVGGDPVLAVGLLEGGDEGLVLRGVGRLVVVPGDEVADDVLDTDAGDL